MGINIIPQITLKALTYFADGNLPSLPEATRARLVQAVRAVYLNQLPVISDLVK